jgi:hypothetical protein
MTMQDIQMPRVSLSHDRRIALLAEYLAGARIDFLAVKYGVHRSYPRHLFRRYSAKGLIGGG